MRRPAASEAESSEAWAFIRSGAPAEVGRRVRRRAARPVGVVFVSAVALFAAGCGNPAGVDGALVDDWPAVSEPKSWTPPAEVCFSGDFSEAAYLSSFSPVDCATAHRTETVYVGTFFGEAANASAPPGKDSNEIRAAYSECDTKAKEYVGADWRAGRLWLGVALPSPQAWTGGARWFRCDMTEVTNVEDNGDTATRTATLRDAFEDEGAGLALTCYAVKLAKDGSIDTMPAAECGKDHNSEFVGVWNAGNTAYPSKDADWDKIHDQCRKVAARYVGVPDDGNLKYRTGVISLPGGSEDWAAGNRGVRCYLWLSKKKLTRSLKGTGTTGLPIQYE